MCFWPVSRRSISFLRIHLVDRECRAGCKSLLWPVKNVIGRNSHKSSTDLSADVREILNTGRICIIRFCFAVSAPSTFVNAAQFRTASGTIEISRLSTAWWSAMSISECESAVTSSPIVRQYSAAARASIPFAPVMSIFMRGLSKGGAVHFSVVFAVISASNIIDPGSVILVPTYGSFQPLFPA